MYYVKVKRYLDSLQIQHFETSAKTKNLIYEEHTLFEDIRIEKEKAVRFKPLEEDNEEEKQKSAESLRISQSRTIRKIYDYGKSNRWEWFFTLTFNPNVVDSFDYLKTSKKLSLWLNNMKKKCPDMKYLVVPERHKSGRWHFHGLFSNVDSLEFVPSGHFTDKGQEVFNVGKYKLGFSTAIKCDGSMKVVGYVTKYITKELSQISMGKKRYWVSRNLDLPDTLKFYTYDSFLDVISLYDFSQAYFKSVEGYKNVNICEIPIYSTNTVRFVENENEQK